MLRSRFFSTTGFILFLFVVFVTLWFYGCNRFHVLHYHEQIQLFRFDHFYFQSYLIRPGGLSGYLGSFLTQFYYYPVAGSIIIAGILSMVFLLFYSICRSCGIIRRLFFIPFIPAVLLMTSFVSIHFYMSSALGILFALATFGYYQTLKLPARFFAGFILFAATYLISGGNALLLLLLIIIFECTDSRHTHKIRYLLLLFIWSAGLPWLAWQVLYTAPLREVYFALTPVDFLFPTTTNAILWLSFPALYLFWRLVAVKVNKWNVKPWRLFVPNCLLAVAAMAGGVYPVSDRKVEMLNQMAFEVQHENWNSVMRLSKAYPSTNRLVCYFTNIALAESGQMPYRMFHYRQTGVTGLFLDWQSTYSSLWHIGEVYFRLGMMPAAEHCAFEALVSNPKEPNAQTMRRLVTTNIARRDSLTAVKYIGYFERSLAYREWAQQQHANLSSAMACSPLA